MTKVGLILNAFCLVFRNLTFTDDFVRVNACWVRSWVRWDDKFGSQFGEGDILCLFDYHANVAMLSTSILGCNAASGIGSFFREQV
jgi:hypothetical protein